MQKTVAEFLEVNEFPLIVKDDNGNIIYEEMCGGSWWIRKYDFFGNCIKYKDSTGYEELLKYKKNRLIHRKTSEGYWESYKYNNSGLLIYFEDSSFIYKRWEYDSHGVCNFYEEGYMPL